MIVVTDEFTAAQNADSAQPVYQVNLVFQDLCASVQGSTITSSGDDASGNYPAVGAINSDHTEINIGAASGADNGVGKSSWKSATSPSVGSPVWLIVNFNRSVTLDRIKVYNRAANPLTSYAVQYYDGTAWVTIAGTPDQIQGTAGGYGTGGYGQGPYGSSDNGGWPGLGHTGGLDVYDLGAPLTLLYTGGNSAALRLIVYGSTSGPAEVVEFESYQVVDITARCTRLQGPDRKKDFKLQQPICTQEVIIVDNSDGYFSFAAPYTPSVSVPLSVTYQLGLLGINLEVNEGFYTTLGPEMIRTFTGSIDSISPTAETAECEIAARDSMKHIINNQDSTGLLQNQDIADCVRYVLNRCGISDYEMTLPVTDILIPYFYASVQTQLSTIQLLIQAAGDAIFYFDEWGNAVMQYYLAATPQQQAYADASAWNSGTLTNIDMLSSPNNVKREWFYLSSFTNWPMTNPVWIAVQPSGPSVTSGILTIANQPNPHGGLYAYYNAAVYTSYPTALSTWDFKISITTGQPGYCYGLVYFYGGTTAIAWEDSGGNYLVSTVGYAFKFLGNGNWSIIRSDYSAGAFTQTVLVSGAYTPGFASLKRVRVTRNNSGDFSVYIEGTLQGSTSSPDATYTSFGGLFLFTTFSDYYDSLRISEIFATAAVDGASAVTNAAAMWLSPVIDRGADLSASGIFNAATTQPSGTAINFFSRVSPDKITWGSWIALTPGQQDGTALQRYEQISFALHCPAEGGQQNIYTTPILYSMSLSWHTGSGQQKWSPTVNFYLTDTNGICTLQQQISDNLGGDSSIINDVAVTSSPLIKEGASTDTQWQAVSGSMTYNSNTQKWGLLTTGVPQVVSASYPLTVPIGTIPIQCIISSGMVPTDMLIVSNDQSGHTITLGSSTGTARGTVYFSFLNPTEPIITLHITTAGNITDLRICGPILQGIQTPYQSLASDAKSIAIHNRRHQDIQNDYFRDGSITDIVAARIIANQAYPTEYIPKFEIFPPRVNMQPGDRINVVNGQTGVSADYYVVGFSRSVEISDKNASAGMSLVLMEIPIA